jgi:hypothetical protein
MNLTDYLAAKQIGQLIHQYDQPLDACQQPAHFDGWLDAANVQWFTANQGVTVGDHDRLVERVQVAVKVEQRP